MPRESYGNKIKARTKNLLKAILIHARDNFPEDSSKVNFLWDNDDRWLRINTEIRHLAYLLDKKNASDKTLKAHVSESLRKLEDIGIVEDTRMKRQGSSTRLFTLKLKYPKDKVQSNLEWFEKKWTDYKERKDSEKPEKKSNTPSPTNKKNFSISSMPKPRKVYGRQQEIERLHTLLLDDSYSLVAISGMGGIGKTTLAAQIIEQIKEKFDRVVWRSLRDCPPAIEFVETLIKRVNAYSDVNIPNNFEDKLELLVESLNTYKSVLIFDNYESVLDKQGSHSYENRNVEKYRKIIQYLATTNHKSKILITTREITKDLSKLQGINKPVYLMEVQCLDFDSAHQIIQDSGCLISSESDLEKIIKIYDGHPLFLELVSKHITDVFSGNVSEFIRNGESIFDDLENDFLDTYFLRLSQQEQELVYWLAINRRPVTLAELKQDLISPKSKKEIATTVQALKRKFTLEEYNSKFSLPSILMEYVTQRITHKISREVQGQADIVLLYSHALAKATDDDYIRAAQERTIVNPIIQQSLFCFQNKENFENRLREILNEVREKNIDIDSYIAGNIFNISRSLSIKISNYDFSSLRIRQAFLQGTHLQQVNFRRAHFQQSVFTQAFGNVNTLDFSPNGKLMAFSSAKNIFVRRLADHQHILSLQGHDNWIRTIVFSPNNQFLASASDDGTAKIWNLANGQCLQTLSGDDLGVYSISFSPDGKSLVTTGANKLVKVWNLENALCMHELHGHEDWTHASTFSPNGKIIASSSKDTTIRLWDAETGECLRKLEGHRAYVTQVSFAPDSSKLASVSLDRVLRIWDLASTKVKCLDGHTNWIWTVRFSPDGSKLASAGDDKTVRVWDTETCECLLVLQGHKKRIWRIAFHPDGETIASVGEDQTIRFWDIGSGQAIRVFQGYMNGVRAVSFSQNSDTIYSSHDDGKIRAWNLEEQSCSHLFENHHGSVLALGFSRDDQMFVSGGSDQNITIWNLLTKSVHKEFSGHTDEVWDVVFSPDNRMLASGSSDHSIKVWDLQSRAHITLNGHTNRVSSVIFDHEGTHIISASEDRTIKVWDINSQQCLSTLVGHEDRVMQIALHPDGKRLASVSLDKTIRIWETHNWEILESIPGHDSWILSVSYSMNGKLLVTGGADGFIKLWDAKTLRCLQESKAHNNWIWSVAFSPDDLLIASASEDGIVKVWDVTTYQCTAILKPVMPYSGMKIGNAKGILPAQKEALLELGARDF